MGNCSVAVPSATRLARLERACNSSTRHRRGSPLHRCCAGSCWRLVSCRASPASRTCDSSAVTRDAASPFSLGEGTSFRRGRARCAPRPVFFLRVCCSAPGLAARRQPLPGSLLTCSRERSSSSFPSRRAPRRPPTPTPATRICAVDQTLTRFPARSPGVLSVDRYRRAKHRHSSSANLPSASTPMSRSTPHGLRLRFLGELRGLHGAGRTCSFAAVSFCASSTRGPARCQHGPSRPPALRSCWRDGPLLRRGRVAASRRNCCSTSASALVRIAPLVVRLGEADDGIYHLRSAASAPVIPGSSMSAGSWTCWEWRPSAPLDHRQIGKAATSGWQWRPEPLRYRRRPHGDRAR